MSEIGLVMRNGGFLLFVLFAWFVFSRQRDVLETAETTARILAGTLLVLLQLTYYTALVFVVFVPLLRLTPQTDISWVVVGLTIVYILPLLISVASFVIYPWVLRRRWRLCPVEAGHPIHQTIIELTERLGLNRPVTACWAAALIPSPLVFQPLFRPATLILPLDWALWGTRYAQSKQTVKAIHRFVLLHEISHVRNGDVFFMTWAGVFLWSYRLWAPIVVATQLVVLLMGLNEWLTVVLGFGVVATLVIYPLFQLLYLSVSRQRELLADARAQLYVGEKQLSLILQQSTMLAETARPQETDTWWRVWGWFIVNMIRTLVSGRSLLAVLPAGETEGRGGPSFLATHPPRRVRRHALQERLVIQSHMGNVSSSTACWVGIIVGVFTNFLFLPFIDWVMVFAGDSTHEALFIWGQMLTALYPVLALSLPLRNALSHFQPLGVQVRHLLWRFGQAGLGFLGVCLLGYINAQSIFLLVGWEPESIGTYANQAVNCVILGPLISIFLLGFMRYMFRLWEHESILDVVWLWVWAVVLASVVVFPIGQIHSSSSQPVSYNILALLASIMAVVAGMLTVGRLVSGTTDFRRRIITIYWGGNRPRFWRKECGTTVEHLLWSGLMTTMMVGLATVVPAWLARRVFETLCHTVPASMENPWIWLMLFTCIVVALLFTFERTARITSRLTEGIIKRGAFFRDAGWLVETGSVLGIDPAQTPKAPTHCLPAELLKDRTDTPSMTWWIPAMTLEAFAPASRLVEWYFGPGAISVTAVEHVERCACCGGGFSLWPGGFPRLSATYYALYVLNVAVALDRIDLDVHSRWILSCADEGGGFCSPEHQRPSLQDTVDAIQSLSLLDHLKLVDRIRCARWITRVWLQSDRSLSRTRRAVICLALLDEMTPNFVTLLESSWLPRHRSLILSMRVDKQIDHVWNYVQIVSHLFTPPSAAFVAWTEGLSTNVSEGLTAFFGTVS